MSRLKVLAGGQPTCIDALMAFKKGSLTFLGKAHEKVR